MAIPSVAIVPKAVTLKATVPKAISTKTIIAKDLLLSLIRLILPHTT